MAISAQQYVDDFNRLINAGAYEDAARLVKQAEGDFGPDVYRVAATVLEANTNLPSEIDYISPQGIQSIKDYVDAVAAQPSAPTPASVNTFDTQLSGLFDQYLGRAPTDRELGIYRKDFGAEIDPTEISEFLRRSREEITNRGNVDVNKLFEGDKIPTPEEINQAIESSGGFQAPQPAGAGLAGIPRYAPQEFTPLTFAPIRRGSTQLAGPAQMPGLTSGQPSFGGTYNISSRPVAPAPFALPQDFALQTGAYGAPVQPTTAAEAPVGKAEGGDIEAMPKLSAKEAGSQFDMSQFVNKEGRLVGGYSRPILNEFGVITGYDFQPYQRDVVFNPRLAEAEARGMSDEEREQMMAGLAMRQGRTGINPMGAGLAAIPVYARDLGMAALQPAFRNRPSYYAEGGLANAAQNLASRGRYGDSVLVHMAPEELSGLRALARAQGNDLTINPRTGLPEAFSLKKLFEAASFILPFVPIPGLFGMSSLLTRSILSGVAAGASAKGKFDFKQALGGGLRAYAMGSLGEKLGGGPATPGGPTTTTTTPTTVPDAAAVNPMAGMENIEVPLSGQPALGPSVPIYEGSIGPAGGPDLDVRTPSVPGSVPEGGTVPGIAPTVITPEGQGYGQPLTKGTEIAMAGLGGLSIEEGAKEQRNYEIEAAAARREEEERKRRFDQLFARTLGNVRTAKQGGLMKLAGGGVTYMEGGGATGPAGEPRVVRGTGDGMSDSVPATIEGVQEARLANDEFVIPADVVADIGNGSSDAGAKKLYGMMDRIRKARHGTTKQPPEIKAERLMPA